MSGMVQSECNVDVEHQHFSQLDSTNNYLLHSPVAVASQFPPTRRVLACSTDEQTAGRGRLGRVWHSPVGQNVLLSVAAWLPVPVLSMVPMSVAAGLRLASLLEPRAGLAEYQLGLKWPNDLVVTESQPVAPLKLAKLGGVLVESRVQQDWAWCVIGVGFNVQWPLQVEVLNERYITSLRAVGAELSVAEARQTAIEALSTLLIELRTGELDWPACLAEWPLRDVLCGHELNVRMGDRLLSGVAAGMNDAGCLQLRQSDGEVIKLASGEVQQVRADTGIEVCV